MRYHDSRTIRLTSRLYVANEAREYIPPAEVQKRIAREAGALLEEALMTGYMDTEAPMYVGAVQEQDFLRNATIVDIALDYLPREAGQPALDVGTNALRGARGVRTSPVLDNHATPRLSD